MARKLSIFFSKELSDTIIKTLLAPQEPTWEQKLSLLDEFVPLVVAAGYDLCTGIRDRFDKAEVRPEDIVDFESYERLLPHITPLEMMEMGEHAFESEFMAHSLRSGSTEYDTLAEQLLSQEVNQKRKVFKARVSRADARAASLTLAGQLIRKKATGDPLLVNQRPDAFTREDVLLRQVVIPALQIAGVKPKRMLHETDMHEMLATANGRAHLLLPPGKKQSLHISDLSGFNLVLSVGDRVYHDNSIYLGDFNPTYGIFPNLGYRMPVPGFVRIVNAAGRIPLDGAGKPDVNQRGRLVVDWLFSAYELPTPWTALKDGLMQALDYMELTGEEELLLDKFWRDTIGDDYLFREQYHRAAEEADLAVEERVHIGELLELTSCARRHWTQSSIRIGIPNATWLLKVGFPLAGQLTYDGVLHDEVPLSAGTAAPYIVGKDLRVKFPPSQTPYTSSNQVGRFVDGTALPPELVASSIAKRIDNAIKGRNQFGPNEHGYTMTASIVSPGDFANMLQAAHAYARQALPEKVTFSDVLDIITRLYRLVEKELEGGMQGEPAMVAVFADKTRIPISEIAGLVERAGEDFIARDGRGLKEMAYAALVDSSADMPELSDAELVKGLQTLKTRKVISPVFMVTPGNITLYDSIMLFGQILLTKLADESIKRFTMFIRPSESDVTFNFLVHHYHAIAQELDPNNRKGLRTLFQKAYWDPRYDQTFLRSAMKAAEAGIYYGTAKTYMEARFLAATDRAAEEGFDVSEIDRLLQLAARKQLLYHPKTLEVAASDGVDLALLDFVGRFLEHHRIYPETLNAVILLPDIPDEELDSCAASLLSQVISLRGADCTNANKVWVPASLYEPFMHYFRTRAEGLFVGDVMDPNTSLAQYDSDYLKGTAGIITDEENTVVLSPMEIATGRPAPVPINPRKNYTGVILTELDAEFLLHGDPFDREDYIAHLAKELPLPWLSVIRYDDMGQVLQTMKDVLDKYSARSGYPRYLYIAAMGHGDVAPFEEAVRDAGLADLLKKGEEAHRQFIYYRPHQGGFFMNDLVR